MFMISHTIIITFDLHYFSLIFSFYYFSTLSAAANDIMNFWRDFSPVSGEPEDAKDSLTAMMIAAGDDSLGWRGDTADGRKIYKVIMIITASNFQYTKPGIEGLSYPGLEPKKPNSMTTDYDCGVDVSLNSRLLFRTV